MSGSIVSTNIGEKVTITHNGREIQTGIYKYSTDDLIHLGKTDVEKDSVVDRRFHGGVDKACYLYPSENYGYWQEIFPDMEMEWGMFGENLTTEGLVETEVRIGSLYEIGETVVQVAQPRQPCYKLNIRFEDNRMVRLFSESSFPGIYVRVLKEGKVKRGDGIELVEEKSSSLSVSEVYALLMRRNRDIEMAKTACSDISLAESAKKDLVKIFGGEMTE